ncbi:MAG: adenylate/guanylate cyclase domain-containing protein [Armatimonadetes bacterium]|nr:adenylate/guanylate cyclase domain-containing protein [Armatimonadota bacterium]
MQKLRKDLHEIQRRLHKEHTSLGRAVSQNEEICAGGELRQLAVDVRALRMDLTQVEFQLKKLSEEISRDHLAGMLQKHKTLQETTEAVTHEILDKHGRDLTIIFTDMKDFTKKSSEGNLVQMMAMLEEHDGILIPIIEQHGGTVIKKIGDALMASFEHPAHAVLAGTEIQRALQRHNQRFPDEAKKIQVRIGVNCGKVVVKDGDLYGDTVNLASRVEGLARAEQIFITDSVYQFIDINQIPCIKLPPQKVKGLEKEVQIYEVQY